MTIVYLIFSFLFFVFFTLLLIRREIQKFRFFRSYNQESSFVLASIRAVSEEKKKFHFVCEYASPTNKMKFNKLFSVENTKENQIKYKMGTTVKIRYPKNVMPKSTFFPLVLDEKSPNIYNTSFFIMAIFVLTSGLVFGYFLISLISAGFFTTTGSEITITTLFDPIALFTIVVMYVIGMQTVTAISFNMSKDDSTDHIKLFGKKALARVVKSKPTGAKSKGLKEELLDIEYFDQDNVKTITRLTTFYFKHTDYIDILYSPLNHKNVVLCEK